MGITLFEKRLSERLAKWEKIREDNIPKDGVAGLYFDFNSVIHTAAGHRYAMYDAVGGLDKVEIKACCDLVIAIATTIIDTFKPTEMLYVAVDGVIPMAKIQQQKERRYSSSILRKEEDYDSTFITPGTEFMGKLHIEIGKWVREKHRKFYNHVKVVSYSSHLTPGEGEHKIMEFMRANTVDGVNIIYGNDSDLILLSLALQKKQLYVCKDTVWLYDNDKPINRKVNMPINIDELRVALVAEMGGDYILDFVFACSLLGNDFLPRPMLLASVGDTIDTLITLIGHNQGVFGLRDDGVGRLSLLFQQLATLESFETEESDLLKSNIHNLSRKALSKEMFVNKNKGIKHQMFQSPMLESVATYEGNDLKNKALAYMWYSKMTPLTTSVAKAVGDSCVEYLRGLQWVYSYYLTGQKNVTWLWYYPYYYVPLFSDIYNTFMALSDDDINKTLNVLPVRNEQRFTPLHQLVAVMPWGSRKFVPDPLPNMFYSVNSPLMDMMPVTVVEDPELTESSLQVKSIVPFARYYDIMYYMSQRQLPDTVIAGAAYIGPYYEKKDELQSDRDRRKLRARDERKNVRDKPRPEPRAEVTARSEREDEEPRELSFGAESVEPTEAGRGERGRGRGRGDRGGRGYRGRGSGSFRGGARENTLSFAPSRGGGGGYTGRGVRGRY